VAMGKRVMAAQQPFLATFSFLTRESARLISRSQTFNKCDGNSGVLTSEPIKLKNLCAASISERKPKTDFAFNCHSTCLGSRVHEDKVSCFNQPGPGY
jgi:hypothetical protein